MEQNGQPLERTCNDPVLVAVAGSPEPDAKLFLYQGSHVKLFRAFVMPGKNSEIVNRLQIPWLTPTCQTRLPPKNAVSACPA